jgi:UDP-glucose:(heptosyl)LPS alpha-1,3-glucosyltransferase
MSSVALIIERTITALGGAERSIAELAGELANQGIDVRILAAAGQSSSLCTALCSPNPLERTSYRVFEQALRSHLSQNHYDIIHSVLPFEFADIYQPRGGSYREAMLQNAESFNCPVMRFWKRSSHVLNFRRTAFLRAEKKLCLPGRTTMVAALSDYVRQQFVKHYGLSDQRVALIPNGIQVNRAVDVSYADAFRRDMLSRLSSDIRPNAVIFFFAANNFRLKGLRQLILAFARANQNPLPAPGVLVIAGSDKFASYRKLASSLGVESRIVFCGPQKDAFSALSVCDAAILPSWYDPCSRFILEALALAKPVITTRLNGAGEQYQANRHGFIVDNPASTEAIADAIRALCDGQIRSSFAQAIQQDGLKDEISITRHVGQLRRVYDIILAQKKGTAR